MKNKPVNFSGLKIFVSECEKWGKIFAPEFDIQYKTSDMTEMATVEFQLGTGTAEITISEKHTHDIHYEIRKSAFEEIMHLCFAEYSSVVDSWISKDFLLLQEHKIINKLKRILIKK